MADERMSIGDLADRAGVSRRTIRFYVQRGLLPPPSGYGRGSGYDHSHLDRVGRILELQAAGHSLVAIVKILAGGGPEGAPQPLSKRRARVTMSAGLWTRVSLAEGIELHVDATEYNPSVEELLAIQASVRSILGQDSGGPADAGERNDHE